MEGGVSSHRALSLLVIVPSRKRDIPPLLVLLLA
jgi:hypothetical protein